MQHNETLLNLNLKNIKKCFPDKSVFLLTVCCSTKIIQYFILTDSHFFYSGSTVRLANDSTNSPTFTMSEPSFCGTSQLSCSGSVSILLKHVLEALSFQRKLIELYNLFKAHSLKNVKIVILTVCSCF